MNFGYLFLLLHGKTPWQAAAAEIPSVQKAPPGWENTMAAKDGKTSKLRPKTP